MRACHHHRSGHAPKKHLQACTSSPEDFNMTSASSSALDVSSSCSSPPGDGPQRIRHSVFTHVTKPEVAKRSSVKDNKLETLFIGKHLKHTPVTILNNISLCFDGHDMDSTEMKGLENVKVVSKVSVLEGGEITESESEGTCLCDVPSRIGRLEGGEVTESESKGACLRAVTSRIGRLEGGEVTESESKGTCLRAVPSRRDRLEGGEVSETESDDTACCGTVISRRGSLEGGEVTKMQSDDTTTSRHANNDVTTSNNECAACLLARRAMSEVRDVTTSDEDALAATPSVQQVKAPQGTMNGSSGRHVSRWRCSRRRGRRDPTPHAPSRSDKKLVYLQREAMRVHGDLERLSQGYTFQTTDAPTLRAEDDLRDVRLLDEMIMTLEGQLERMSMRKRRVNNKRHLL